MVVPVTSTLRGIPWHVVVNPPEDGLKNPSAVMCEAVRSISKSLLVKRLGSVSRDALSQVEDRLRILLRL